MPDPLALSDERAAILASADRYARERLAPLARRMDDEEWWPDAEFRALGKAGWLGVTVPPELGGAGQDLFASGLVCQAFARWNHALALSWVAHENLCLNNILRNADDEQRRRFVPGLCDGSLVGCLALTEPGAGSDALGGMATVAVRDGDAYVLTGRKLYITNGPSPTSPCSTRRPTWSAARAGSPPSSSSSTRPAPRSRRSSRRWASAARRPRSSPSTAAACRCATASAARTRACAA